jgi:hypothetical protein
MNIVCSNVCKKRKKVIEIQNYNNYLNCTFISVIQFIIFKFKRGDLHDLALYRPERQPWDSLPPPMTSIRVEEFTSNFVDKYDSLINGATLIEQIS